VIVVDTNVLVYAHRREPVEHGRASELLRGLAEGSEPWAIPWPCVYEFSMVRLSKERWEKITQPDRLGGSEFATIAMQVSG
jgi:uncharacterized protein